MSKVRELMRTLIVYGRSQADAVSLLLNYAPHISASFRICYVSAFDELPSVGVPMVASEIAAPEDVVSAALLFEQRGRNSFPLRHLLPADCVTVTFPSIEFNLLWPLSCTNPFNDEGNPEFPFGHYPYGDRVIVEGVQHGLDADEILAHYFSVGAAYLPNMDHFYRIELARLTALEAPCDVKMADFAFASMRTERLFWTYNHPAMPPLRELIRRLLQHAGAFYPELLAPEIDESIAGWYQPEGPLNMMRVPIHPGIVEHWGLDWCRMPDDAAAYGYANNPMNYRDYFADMVHRSISVRDAEGPQNAAS
jgi:hypothetical protein